MITKLEDWKANEKKKLDKPGQEDIDMNNDGKVDKSDFYLLNKRLKIKKAINNESSINEGIIFDYDGLPRIGDTVVKIKYSDDMVDYTMRSGQSICGFTSCKRDVVELEGLTAEYNALELEFKEPFTINERKARISDIMLVYEELKEPKLMIKVTIEDPFRGFQSSTDGNIYYMSDYIDYAIDDLRKVKNKKLE